MKTQLTTTRYFQKLPNQSQKSGTIPFAIASAVLLCFSAIAYDFAYSFISAMGTFLSLITFFLVLMIDNYFVYVEALSIIVGWTAVLACITASIGCLGKAVYENKKAKLEIADIEYDQDCLVFITKDKRYVLTEIQHIYRQGEKYHIDGKVAKYTEALGKPHTVHLDIVPMTYQNYIQLCDVLDEIAAKVNGGTI